MYTSISISHFLATAVMIVFVRRCRLLHARKHWRGMAICVSTWWRCSHEKRIDVPSIVLIFRSMYLLLLLLLLQLFLGARRPIEEWRRAGLAEIFATLSLSVDRHAVSPGHIGIHVGVERVHVIFMRSTEKLRQKLWIDIFMEVAQA